MEDLVRVVFNQCVYVLQVLGGRPGEYGFGYELANLLIFVVVQPGLILLFFILWRKEKAIVKE
jgi:hypothetical protein